MTDVSPPKMFDKTALSDDVIVKHYYDLFAYHAGQRLTTFNFFVVSLSFLSSAYALLLTKGEEEPVYYAVSFGLALIASVLIVLFARLDRRNAQIIGLNETPLRTIQGRIAEAVRLENRTGVTGNEFESMKISDEQAYRFQTFSVIIPLIYTAALTLAGLGALQSWLFMGYALPFALWIAVAMYVAGVAMIHTELFGRRLAS